MRDVVEVTTQASRGLLAQVRGRSECGERRSAMAAYGMCAGSPAPPPGPQGHCLSLALSSHEPRGRLRTLPSIGVLVWFWLLQEARGTFI